MSRRAHVVRAILLVWLCQLTGAVLVAAPLASALVGTGVDDRHLFEPGGLLLVEAIRVGAGSLVAALRASSVSLAIVTTFGLVPLAALLVALAAGEALPAREWLGRALSHFPAFVLLGGATLLGRVLVLVVALLLWGSLTDPLHGVLSERNADLVLLGGALLAAAALAMLGLLHDLSRAAVVLRARGALAALRAGAGALSRRPLAAFVGWLIPASWSVAVVAGAAIVVGLVRVEAPGSWRVLVALVVHQAAAVALVFLRALWLGRALSLVRT